MCVWQVQRTFSTRKFSTAGCSNGDITARHHNALLQVRKPPSAGLPRVCCSLEGVSARWARQLALPGARDTFDFIPLSSTSYHHPFLLDHRATRSFPNLSSSTPMCTAARNFPRIFPLSSWHPTRHPSTLFAGIAKRRSRRPSNTFSFTFKTASLDPSRWHRRRHTRRRAEYIPRCSLPKLDFAFLVSRSARTIVASFHSHFGICLLHLCYSLLYPLCIYKQSLSYIKPPKGFGGSKHLPQRVFISFSL